MTKKPIYLDYCATTPLDPRVLEAMMPYMTEKFGNSASGLHAYGWEAAEAVEQSRRKVAETLSCSPHEITFTSGATESNNWALQGLVKKLKKENPQAPVHILSSATEHSSITNTLIHLKEIWGINVELVPASKYGIVEIAEIEKRITPHTKLLSFMWVNNELGSINPITEIALLAKKHKIYFHSDATQALGKIPVDLAKTAVDMISFSAHKVYGPKGVGALFLRGQNPKVQIEPLLLGGGQEHGLRSGTVNVAGVVGLASALGLIKMEESERISQLRNNFLNLLQQEGLDYKMNGSESKTVPHIISLTLKPLSSDIYTGPIQIPGLAISRGSACHTGNSNLEMSPVLKSLGFSAIESDNTVRISLGRMTTNEELLVAAKLITRRFQHGPTTTHA